MRTRIRRAYPFAAIILAVIVQGALPLSGVFAGRKALQEAAEKLPRDPYAWYNLGLVYKDISEQEKAIEAFQHVTEIAPTEPDAFYFIGYLNTQLQKYDAAIAAFESALAVFPF